MNTMPINMSVAELKANLISAITKEHTAIANVLWYLAEYESRDLHLRDGYSSLFKFLTEGHGYSEGAAGRRCVAARFARKHPDALKMISRGDLSLSVIGMIVRAEIKSDVIATVLTEVKRKSKTQAEMILLKYNAVPTAPKKKEKVKAVIIAAPTSKETSIEPSTPLTPRGDDSVSSVFQSAVSGAEKEEPVVPTSIAFQVSLCLSETSMQKLKRAQELMGTTDLASTIEELAAFYNKRKIPSLMSHQKHLQKRVSLLRQRSALLMNIRKHQQRPRDPAMFLWQSSEPFFAKREVSVPTLILNLASVVAQDPI